MVEAKKSDRATRIPVEKSTRSASKFNLERKRSRFGLHLEGCLRSNPSRSRRHGSLSRPINSLVTHPTGLEVPIKRRWKKRTLRSTTVSGRSNSPTMQSGIAPPHGLALSILRSNMTVSIPFSWAKISAAQAPAGPPPTTATLYFMFKADDETGTPATLLPANDEAEKAEAEAATVARITRLNFIVIGRRNCDGGGGSIQHDRQTGEGTYRLVHSPHVTSAFRGIWAAARDLPRQQLKTGQMELQRERNLSFL